MKIEFQTFSRLIKVQTEKGVRKNNSKRIYQTPRFRKDVKKIIINTKEVSAERIIPAINFNLIFEPEIYILPGQLDLWRFSKRNLILI